MVPAFVPRRDSRQPLGLVALVCVLALSAALAAESASAAAPQLAAAGSADPATGAAASTELVEQGRRLYAEGIRVDGSPLVADRLEASPLSGAAAACVACHRRSGMGEVEGEIIVPPINGLSLYAGDKLRDRVVIAMDPRRGRAFNQSHAPYDATTLMAAIRDGVHVSGRKMNALMPRYRINEADFLALKAYLDQLSITLSPGVTNNSVRLATVIAPGMDPVRKDAFLRSIHALLDQKNSNTMPGHRHMISAAEGMLSFERNWDLDVWELQGPPETWQAQLEQAYARAPVFALVSGLGGGQWAPVQDFCERGHIPCWFPSIVAPPPGADHQTYSLYFSAGVGLEADVLAQWLAGEPEHGQPQRIVQVLRDEAAAQSAAAEFDRRVAPGMKNLHRVLGPSDDLSTALAGLRNTDALVLWLGPADLAALAQLPAPLAPVYVSTLLGGTAPRQLPAQWRAQLHLLYPYELPQKREHNMATFHSWVALRQLPLVDEAMQSEVFFSVGYFVFTMSEMLDNVYRDCLIDRGETNVRRREMLRAEEETMVRQGGHPPARRVAAASTYAPGAVFGTDTQGPLAQKNTPKGGERQGTTIYPHLSMAAGQRFASKGAYVVRFAQADGEALVAESDWIVP